MINEVNLEERLAELRKDLIKDVKVKEDLQKREIIQKSKRLDELIISFMKLKYGK
jgi:hypothetical protein